MTSEQRKGYRILRTMFEISKTTTRRSDRECFNQVVRFLADYARVHPMPKEDRPVADRLMSLARPLLAAWHDEPDDYLGQLFSEQNCAIDRMGQVMTPPWIVSYINDSVIGKVEEMEEGAEERWKKRPEFIREQVQVRQAELQAQGDSVDGDIAHAHHRLAEVDSERAFYQRQAARGKLTEAEFDARMEETEEARRYWRSELVRLRELRDNRDMVQAGLDYATKLLTTIQKELPRIDIPYKELRGLPKEERDEILRARRDIIRALVDSVVVYADGRVIIEGLLDGSEAARFDLADLSTSSGVI